MALPANGYYPSVDIGCILAVAGHRCTADLVLSPSGSPFLLTQSVSRSSALITCLFLLKGLLCAGSYRLTTTPSRATVWHLMSESRPTSALGDTRRLRMRELNSTIPQRELRMATRPKPVTERVHLECRLRNDCRVAYGKLAC